MREKHRVEVEEITCDICHTEIDECDKKDSFQIPFKQMLETPIDVCKYCYDDLEEYFREKFKEEE